MGKKTISAQPLEEGDEILVNALYKSFAAQSDLLDTLSERLLTIELAIPGAFAAIIKLIAGDSSTISPNIPAFITIVCWLLALVLTLTAIIPRKWSVDPDILRQDPALMSESLGVMDFFERTALHKRRLLIASSLLFFAGIVAAFFTTIG